ncbi:hypothetical protein SELMODRAFT_431393 [Selaginella moellendorffii]|uniref:Uncharacterized protein n=1 Tax=Selaginella moellendorffii TaxID=88036 RepID=D8TCG3_SELML|nr:hypothetical protein SELMODRAFT_431393 [Selaginella moellendorffii]
MDPAAPVPPELECDDNEEQRKKRPRFPQGEVIPLADADPAPHTPEAVPHAPGTDADPAALQPPLLADLALVLPAERLLTRICMEAHSNLQFDSSHSTLEMPEVGFGVKDNDWEWKVDVKELFGSCFQ